MMALLVYMPGDWAGATTDASNNTVRTRSRYDFIGALTWNSSLDTIGPVRSDHWKLGTRRLLSTNPAQLALSYSEAVDPAPGAPDD